MKTFKLFLFSLCTIPVFAQIESGSVHVNRDINGATIQNDQPLFREPSFLHSTPFTAATYDSVRALSELNVMSQADAYPWISSDGLRLYYISGDNGNHVMFTQRNDTNSYFGTPSPVSFPIPDPFSIWLSEDELDLYLCALGEFNPFYFHRDSISAPFNAPVIQTLTGISLSFIAGVSLNNAQDQLFLYSHSAFGSTGVREFTKTGPDVFAYTRILPMPFGSTAAPGQLSKDDFSFILGVEIGGQSLLHQFSRPTPSDSFLLNSLQVIQGINNSSTLNTQPSASVGLNWIVFVASNTNSWTENDLYLAHGGNIVSVFDPDKIEFSVSIFPNPANEKVTFEILENGSLKNLNLSLMNILGEEVDAISVSARKTEINLEEFTAGIYFYQLTNGAEILKTGKFVVE